MTSFQYPWRPSSVLLVISGTLVCGIGVFFMALRPALLPEDIRYMHLATQQIEALGPEFEEWLRHVFTVLGGFAFASGTLLIGVAATSLRERQTIAFVTAVIAGASSIGLMAVVNLVLNSDFKLPLLAIAGLWLLGIGSFIAEGAV